MELFGIHQYIKDGILNSRQKICYGTSGAWGLVIKNKILKKYNLNLFYLNSHLVPF